MSSRPIKNTLNEAAILDRLIADFDGDSADALDRYGHDLLGRAIGHEMAAERRKGLPETMFYSNLIHEVGSTATRKVMAFTAAREVMAAR